MSLKQGRRNSYSRDLIPGKLTIINQFGPTGRTLLFQKGHRDLVILSNLQDHPGSLQVLLSHITARTIHYRGPAG